MTREEAIQYIDGLRCKEDFPYTDTIADFIKERNEAIDMAIEALEADTMGVVWCKDCKHYSEWQNGTGSCQRSENSYFWFGVDFDDFCSFGERSEE